MDFFEQANEHVRELNASERKIFEYVVRNRDQVKDMQIRALAAACFVSTTTIMRFARKLGFSGYREFSESLRFAARSEEQSELPSALWKRRYGEEYLKNIIESVRVLAADGMEQFAHALEADPIICCYGVGMDQEVARFAYRLLASMGFRACCPEERFEVKAALDRFRDGDVALLVSMTGEDREVVEFAERVQIAHRPVVATITHSANNTLQSLSTLDFYVFVERVVFKGEELSSRASMIALVELLSYHLMKSKK